MGVFERQRPIFMKISANLFKKSQHWTLCETGVNVMITIFGEKLAFFSKNNIMIKFLQEQAVVWKKRQYFR
jgi:hypothetical protein